MGLHWITFFHAMQISSVAIGMISLFTYPVMTVLLEPIFNKKRIRLKDIAFACIVLLGILVMVHEDLLGINLNEIKPQMDILAGVLFGMSSALVFAIRNLLQKYHHRNVPSDGLIFHQVIAIALMLVLFIEFDSVSQLSLFDTSLLIMLGVISTATAHSLLSHSLKHFPAKSVAMISCLQPFVAALFAWLVLSEVPSWSVAIGGSIIVSVAMLESMNKREYSFKGT